MINYVDYDLFFYHQALQGVMEFLDIDVSDEEVWEVAREDEDTPCFENLFFILCFGKLEIDFFEKGIDVTYQVNARCSSMSVRVEGDSDWVEIKNTADFMCFYDNANIKEVA